eukprot:TCONS_00013955-protein
MKIAFVLAALVAVCFAAPQRVEVEQIPMIKLVKASKIQRNNNLGFSYSNCAEGSDLNIKSLSISPDPITIPGNVTIGLDAAISTEITDITSAALVLKRKIFGVFVEIPCVDNLGSCTYNDVCSLLAKIECPQQLIDMGFKCHCPFPAKEFNVPAGTVIALPKLPLPSFAENGDYEAKVTLSNGSTVLACYDFKVSLKANSQDEQYHNDVEITV